MALICSMRRSALHAASGWHARLLCEAVVLSASLGMQACEYVLCCCRDYWIQIDIQNVAQGFPAGCVAPSHSSHASLTHQNALLKQQNQHVLVSVTVCLTLTQCVLHGEQENYGLSNAAAS